MIGGQVVYSVLVPVIVRIEFRHVFSLPEDDLRGLTG